MNISEAIKSLEKQIKDPKVGLPEEIFLFVSRLTPLVNVDLLIKDEDGRTLLSWRDDVHGTGWHIPGGIVRFKEKFETRILKVAEREIGVPIEFDPKPLAFNQLICSNISRGHFISVLYKCFLSKKFLPKNNGLTEKDQGFIKWHDNCPKNLIKSHNDVYRNYI
ncbi:MAG: NUDIX hydrolase [Candidatus Shapirobacteria bacterium]|nr:NUDIX hydrolase [Candidatus Shapirobacteria bacterium]